MNENEKEMDAIYLRTLKKKLYQLEYSNSQSYCVASYMDKHNAGVIMLSDFRDALIKTFKPIV